MTVEAGGESVDLARTTDGWRWPGGAAVSGSTPERLAERASGLTAIAFGADPPYELDPPWATVTLTFTGGERVPIELGRKFEVERPAPPPGPPLRPGEPPPPSAPRTEVRRVARVGNEIGVVGGELGESVDDLMREYGRKRDRDAEKRLDAVGAPD
jgi:hypothetical protein